MTFFIYKWCDLQCNLFRFDLKINKSTDMKKKIKWIRVVYIIGIIALIAGIIDPLEGSIIITAGSALIALSTYLSSDRHWKIFLASFIMIVIGVFFLFYFSSLGGFGGKTTLSWW